MFQDMGMAAFASRAQHELLSTGETVRKRTGETVRECTKLGISSRSQLYRVLPETDR